MLLITGLPHSDIKESMVICTSSSLFAAYHVLLRLREPRHPPSALLLLFFLAFLTHPVLLFFYFQTEYNGLIYLQLSSLL